MANRVTWGERLRYAFDKSMAAGPIALVGWLALISLITILIAAVVLSVTQISQDGADPMGFVEAFWESLMRTIDPGTMGSDTGWAFRAIMLTVTLSGIFVFSALIGILSAGVNDRLVELRKGRSRVLENGHTIILNWSPSIFDIISELAIANASERRPRIVVLADMDKVAMEDEIATKAGRLGKTKVICRSGDPTDLFDLALVNPQDSKSVIVLSPVSADPDPQVVKTLLALVNDPRRRATPYRIAAELRDEKNAEMARIVGGSEVQLILADDLISRIVVHTSRQSGLSAVYSELLDFDGCEIYTAEQPELIGKTYGEGLMAYQSCVLIGLCDANGEVKLNPPMDTVINAGTKAIVIAEDDSTIKLGRSAPQIDASALRDGRARVKASERTLILGWNRRAPTMIYELSRYVAPGSTLTVAADAPDVERAAATVAVFGDHLSVDYKVCDSSARFALEGLNIPSYDHVVVLGYSDDLSAQTADTRTLVTLLHLRQITERAGVHVSVVSEMADVRNRELAEVTRADDFVVSNKLVSLMLAQASENQYLSAIFADLLDEAGSEIYMRPASDYVVLDQPVNFYTVTEAARRRGETAIGYCRAEASDATTSRGGGVVVNPGKIEALTYRTGDRIIVLAED